MPQLSQHGRLGNFIEEQALYPSKPGGIPISVIYPNSYYLGMSNLGFHSLCNMIDSAYGLSLERYFIDTSKGNSLVAGQRNCDLGRSKVILATVNYEEDALLLAEILHRSGIELFSKKRKAPFIVIGGALVNINTKLFEDIADVLFQGYLSVQAKSSITSILLSNNFDKTFLLGKFLEAGIYYLPRISLKDNINYNEETLFEQSHYLTPQTEFSNSFLMEIGRGCFSRCVFCSVNQIFPQTIWRDFNEIVGVYNELKLRLLNKIKNIGLIAPVPNSHPMIKKLLTYFCSENVHISLSSIRAEKTDKEFFDLLMKCRQKSFTIAPEVPQETSRMKIGKLITNEEIARCVEDAYSAGFREVKMYFLLGIHGMENPADVEDLKKLLNSLPKKMKLKLSFNPVVPKPKTLIQGTLMEDEKELKKIIKALLMTGRHFRNVHIKIGSLKKFRLQYMIANGDQNILTDLIFGRLKVI